MKTLREAAQQATPREQLLKELMDSRVPKTEREHAAAREIGDLRAALAEDRDAEPGNTLDHIAGANKMVDQSEDALGMVATSQESRQVEPVGYFSINDYGNWEQNESNSGTPLYDAPPKHDPLTDEEIKDLWDEQNFHLTDWHSVIDFVRDIERAHGIGGEE